MAKELSTESESGKRGSYPYASLQKSLEVGAAVAELGGDRMEVQKSVLAHRLNLDESGAAYAQTVSSAKCLGIIDGRGSYVLTEIGRGYFLAMSDGDKRIALLKMLKCPEIYDRLITRFDGSRLPPSESLSTIIGKEYGVSKSWAPRVASLFVSTIRDGGAVDTNGFVRYAANMHSRQTPATIVPDQSVQRLASQPITPAHDPAPQTAKRAVSDDTNTWQFRLGDSVVRLETSRELSPALWQKLNQYVQVLKPSNSEIERFEP